MSNEIHIKVNKSHKKNIQQIKVNELIYATEVVEPGIIEHA